MDDLAPQPIGRRVAAFRKLRGLTQAGLAARLHRSESWVTKIERGERRIDSMSVLAELCRALAVPLYQLTGHYEVRLGGPADGGPDLRALRHVLDGPAIMSPLNDEPRPVADLEKQVTALTRLYNTATHHASAVLPRLADPLTEAQAIVRVGPVAERRRAHAVLSELCWLAASALRHFGDLPRARVASDRALAAAENSEDLLRIGKVAAFHAVQLGTDEDNAAGAAVAVDVANLIAGNPLVETPAGAVVLGGLYGYGAVTAAKAGDRPEARRLMKAGGRIAETLGSDREAYGMHFGPANLASKKIIVLLSEDRPADAVNAGETVSLEQLGAKLRAGHHCSWLAAAHVRCGQDDRALAALATGLRMAPEVVRHHFLARELIRDVLRRCRNADERLRRIAREMNLPG
jgi:transcriptional regulator with XRE-family HTH domain